MLSVYPLYAAYSRLGSENLALRYTIPLFSPNCGDIAYWVTTPCFASPRKQWNENIKYIIFSSGDRTSNLSPLQSHTCAPAPRLASITNLRLILYFYIYVLSTDTFLRFQHEPRALFRPRPRHGRLDRTLGNTLLPLILYC